MRRKLDVIFALASKDWQLLLADKRATFLYFGVPLLLVFILGIALPFVPHERMGTVKVSGFLQALLALCLLFWGMESGVMFLRERKSKVGKRIASTPVPRWCLLTGKVLSTAGVSLLFLAVVFGFGYMAFDEKLLGSVSQTSIFALVATGISALMGLLVSVAGRTEAQARSVCIPVILTTAMLWGFGL